MMNTSEHQQISHIDQPNRRGPLGQALAAQARNFPDRDEENCLIGYAIWDQGKRIAWPEATVADAFDVLAADAAAFIPRLVQPRIVVEPVLCGGRKIQVVEDDGKAYRPIGELTAEK